MAKTVSVASDSEDERVRKSASASSKRRKEPSVEPEDEPEQPEAILGRVPDADGRVIDSDGDSLELYEIETILDVKRGAFPEGRLGYLVKWKGYGDEENSWVDEKDASAEALVADFWRRQQKTVKKPAEPKPKPSPKVGRKSVTREGSLDVGSTSAPKKRGRRPKAPAKVDSDVDMEQDKDEEETRAKKKTRKSNGTAKAQKEVSPEVEADDPPIGNMKKHMGTPNWEKLVDNIDTVEREDDGSLFVYFTLAKSGERVRENSELCAEKFPQKLIKFYESNLRWKQTDGELSS